MDTSYQRSRSYSSCEWYTPPSIVRALGKFDLDPASPVKPQYRIADKTYNVNDDGLMHEWIGRVFLNPPYHHPVVDKFVRKMCKHNNGIALLFDRCDQNMWHESIFPTAHALLFIRGRVRFITPEGGINQNSGCGSVLIAWGTDNARVLKKSGIAGKFINLKPEIELDV